MLSCRKQILLAVFLCSGVLYAENSRHVKPTSDGDLLDDAGNPVFLISTSVKSQIFEGGYEKNYEKFKSFPRHLYGKGYAPARFPLFEKIGMNALNFFGATVSYRVLAREFKGFRQETQLSEAREFYRKYGFDKLSKTAPLPSEKAWREYNELVTEAGKKIPVYLDLHPGLQAKLTSRRDVVKNLFSPEKYFAHPDKHPVFALRFKLCSPEARELQKKLYVDQAQRYLALGVRPFLYKLFNEADYKDYSPGNFRAFQREMEKKYKRIETLNKHWHTRYASFEEMRKTPGAPAKEIEFRKFLERQIADFTGELRSALRTVDPEAVVLSQVHSAAWRANWNNFNQYLINRHTGYVSFGTGNCSLDSGVDAEDSSLPFGLWSDNNSPREYLARTAFYRALADGKPLLNTEAYIAGFGDRYRPFKKAFWHEMIQGSSMMNLWEWGGFWSPWATPTVSFMLHHPKCVKPESWRAVPETLEEFRRTSEFFQRRKNRPKAEAAVLFSYPTLRANQPLTDGFIQGINALLLRNIPADALFEEQLAEGRQDRYRVLLAFGLRNTYPETAEHLRRFVERGGTLITDGLSLKTDEYGVPWKRSFPGGPEIRSGANRLRKMTSAGVQYLDSVTLEPSSPGWRAVLEHEGRTLMMEKKFGKGSVFVLGGTWQDCSASEILAPVFRSLNLRPSAEVFRAVSGERLPYVGVHKGTSGGMTGWYAVNYTNRPQLVRVSGAELAGKGLAAVDFVDRRSYPVENGSVVLLLPALYHRVFITGEKGRVEARFGTFPPVSPASLRKEYESELKRLSATSYVRPSKPVDLRPFANYGFDNQQGWKTPSAWFDSVHRDLVGVPWHGQVFKQVNFNLIRFDFNDNKTCLALKSKNLPDAPSEIGGIPLNEKLRGIALLLAVTHGKRGEIAMRCRFAYEDGAVRDVPIVVGRDTGDWIIGSNSPAIREKCAWQGQNKRGFFYFEWNNPEPSKTLKSLSFLSGCGESIPVVAAVSVLPTTFQKEYSNRIDLARVMSRCNASNPASGFQPDGSLRFSRDNYAIRTPDGKPVPLPKDRIDSAVLRFQLSVLPDAWGKPTPFYSYWWGTGLLGSSGGRGDIRTWPDRNLTLTAQAVVHAVRTVTDYSFPVEVEIPLRCMNMAGEKPFDSISGLFLAAGNGKNNLLLRDLRIEY